MTAVLFSCLVLTSVKCGENFLGDAVAPFFVAGSSNQDILNNLAGNVITAAYRNLETDVAALNTAVQAYNTSPSTTTLSTARERFIQARQRMKEVEPFFFGPSANFLLDASLDNFMRNFSPCNTTSDCSTSVDGHIAGSDTLNAAFISNQGVRVKGLPAIDYLLYDNGSGSNTLADVDTALTGRRLSYLVLIAANAAEVATRLRQGWDPAGLNFQSELSTAGRGSTTYTTELQGLSILVSAMLTMNSSIIDAKIGFPAGFTVKSGGTTHLNDVESPYSENSLTDVQSSLGMLISLYTGEYGTSTGAGLGELARRQNAALDTNLLAQFEAIRAALIALKAKHVTLTAAITNNNDEVRAVYELFRTLRITLGTDLVATSGTNPGVSPNDGD